MPLFYHYTDDEGAQHIIRTGRVMASLKFMSGGDTAYGNGVYLTQLNPETFSKKDIAINNWMNASAESMKKTENYFVFDIPESDVKDTKAKDRNIFLFGFNNDLILHKYPWCLKNFNSNEIVASFKYKLMSLGPAAKRRLASRIMGDYIISEETVNGRPMYVGPGGVFLFMTSTGRWLVSRILKGQNAEGTEVFVYQIECNYSLGPDQHSLWAYGANGVVCQDDSTLKAHPWQV